MSVRKLLDKKGSSLVTARPEDTVETAATLLFTNNIGAVPVRNENGDLIGVLSERDIVRGIAQRGGKIFRLLVRDLMTENVVTCKPEDPIKDAMSMMMKRHIRHLPVVDEDGLCCMISLRDLLQSRLQETETEVNVLRDYAITRK